MNKGLFDHSKQQRDLQQVNFGDVQKTGVCGRIADVLTNKGFQTGSFSISGNNYLLYGQPSKSPLPIILAGGGVPNFNKKESVEDMTSLLYDLNNATSVDSGKFGKTWSDIFNSAIQENILYSEVLDEVAVNTVFPANSFGNKLKMISNVIKARDFLGHDRQFFFVKNHGWDTHGSQLETIDDKFPLLNDALAAFVEEMKDQELWNDVVFVEISDFGRTMYPNSGEGTDHAWAGNYFMFGGSVKSQILGTYPSDFSDQGELSIGRGRLIPTTAYEEIWNGIAQWMGVDDEAGLNKILPGRNNFNLFSESDIFK